MDEPDKLSHLLHRLRTVAPGSSSLQAIVDNLRIYLKRHQAQIPRAVADGGVAAVTRLLQSIVFAAKDGNNTSRTVSDASDQEPVVLSLLSLLMILATEQPAKVSLNNENAVKLFVFLLQSKYSPELHLRTLRTLLTLLHTNPPLVTLLATAPLTATLTAFLDTTSLQDPAIRLLRALSPASAPFRRALLRQGTLPRLLSLLHPDSSEPPILQSALLTITGLLPPGDQPVDDDTARILRGCMAQLVTLAGHEAPGVQQSAVDLLTRMAGSSSLRLDMGSKGVVACFLEQLGFDARQTTVDSLQRKVAFALTLCCRDGFNRAKLVDLGGLRVLVGMLGQVLYQTVHLHILACLPEFRHDSTTMQQLIQLGVLPLVAEYMSAAIDVCQSSSPSVSKLPESPNPPVDDAPASTAATSTFAVSPPRLRHLPPPSPAVSPPSISEELQRDLGRLPMDTGNASPYPSSPGGFPGPRTPGPSTGRYSPVLDDPPGTSASPESPGRLENSVGDLGSALLVPGGSPEPAGGYSPVRVDSPSSPSCSGMSGESPGPFASRRGSGRYSPVLMDVEDDKPSLKRSLSAAKDPPTTKKPRTTSTMSQTDAEKCLRYALGFLESISYQAELTRFLATKPLLAGLLACMELYYHPEKTDTIGNPVKPYSIIQRIVRDRLAFEHVVKSGLALRLVERSRCDAVDAAKKELVKSLRNCAEGDFGFGELLHLCLRAPAPVRMTCVASAAVLLGGRGERMRLWERNGVLEQLMEALSEIHDADEETARVIGQAVHGFFANLSSDADDDPMGLSFRDAALTGCQYEQMPAVDNDAVCQLDDGTIVPVNREKLAAASDVFAALLGSNFIEGRQQIVPIKQTEAQAFTGIVHVLCGCRFTSCPHLDTLLTDPTGLPLLDLVQLSDQFLLFDLRDFASTVLINEQLTPTNCRLLVEQADALHLTTISEGIVQRVVRAEMETGERAAYLRELMGGWDVPGKDGLLTLLRAVITAAW